MTAYGIQCADEDVLCQYLKYTLPHMGGEQSTIAAIDRKPYLPTTEYSYAASIVTVRLANGNQLKLLLKDFGSTQRPKDRLEQRREREVAVYRDLLAQADLGTARYYGSVWDEAHGRFWLLLEFVNGMAVNYAEFPYWVAAAGWLGRMQGYFARHAQHLNTCGFLLRYDADFFSAKAVAAMRAISNISPELTDRLAKIMNGYDRLVDVMASQALTLVHSAYKPTQILVDISADPPRVCPIDWEQAAIGPSLYDLAFLSDGFKSPQLDLLWDAYREEATRNHVSVPHTEEMQYVVDCFRLHRVMNWLSKSVDRSYPHKKVIKLVAMSEQLGARLL